MQILSLRLNNVRRFTDPVEVTGFGPGLNVLSAPNERGKSTLFDALHAVFFEDAKSNRKEIRALVPHAGGDPEIEVEIAHDGARFRIRKLFRRSARGEVSIHRDGHLFKQAGEAEAWLQGLMKAPKDGGPAGLLWVRQGLTSFQDAKETLLARRDLLSSVSGEVAQLTGGRRMEAMRARIREELERFVTRTGRSKTGGPLAAEEARQEALQRQVADLQTHVEELQRQLQMRRELRREQAQLMDEATVAERQDRLQQAEANHAAARKHQERCERATAALQMAEANQRSHQDRLQALRAGLQEWHQAQKAQAQTAEALQQSQQALQQRDAALAEATQQAARCQDRLAEAQQMHERLLRAEAALIAKDRRVELTRRLDQARGYREAAEAAAAGLGAGPDGDQMAALEQAAQAVELARRARDASALWVSVSYQPGAEGRVSHDGEILQHGSRLALPEGGTLALQGIGELQLHPGEQGRDDGLKNAEDRLSRLLQRCGQAGLEAAREAHRSWLAAREAKAQAQQALQLAAPDGLAALQQALAKLPAAEEAAVELDKTAIEAGYETAQAADRQAQARLEKLRPVATEAQAAFQRAGAAQDAALARLQRAEAALGDRDQAAEALTALEAQGPALEQAAESARQALDQLAAAAPDLAQAEAALTRARSVRDQAQQRVEQIGQELAALEARIEIRAGQAVEEELEARKAALTACDARLDSLRFEVAVLQKLDSALAAAQQQAQDHYVGPIFEELQPLLRLLWPDAELRLDAEQVLPEQLQRPGAEDSFEQLSGGTQEQIALLVRLAFAQLLARSGQPAPVILDDAIVYSDDHRIEQIFDLLTRQANGLQIIVFSCRQRAFQNLGGTPLRIVETVS